MFTGEPVKSRAGIRHDLGEESCRALILLGVGDRKVKEALAAATSAIMAQVRQFETDGNARGVYCCGMCSVAYWRHMAAGGLDRNEERLTAGMEALKASRTGGARWKRFPFHYTLLALSEMDIRPALEEMRYVAPALERYLKSSTDGGEYSRRRRLLCQRVLSKC